MQPIADGGHEDVRYHELFQAGPVPSLVTDAAGTVVEANDRAGELLGLDTEAVHTRALADLVVPEDRAALVETLAQLRRGREVDARPLRVATRDDGASIVLSGVRAISSGADQDTLLWVLVDVTEAERAQSALQQAFAEAREQVAYLTELDEWKDAVLAAAAHDLRAPLSIARTALEVLAEQDLDEAQRDDVTARASRALARLDRLLLDLLDLDRLTRGTVGIRREPVVVDEVVAEAIADVQTDEAPVSVEVEVEPDLTGTFDRVRLRQLVAHLLRNAVEHTPSGTPVRVRATRANGTVRIVVEDDGPGIPDNMTEDVFAPFVSRARPGGRSRGTGLGLSLVQLFAELHGGDVQLRRSPTGGARFEVDLPTG